MFNFFKKRVWALFKNNRPTKVVPEKWLQQVKPEFEWPDYKETPRKEDSIIYDEVPDIYRSAGLFFDQVCPYVIMAGPFRNKPMNVRGLCLDDHYYFDNNDWLYHIKDFSIPDDKEEFKALLYEVHKYGCEKKMVYVGCKGGFGRTGLALACLLKMLGVENPIHTVRSFYDHRAVETPHQKQFVEEF